MQQSVLSAIPGRIAMQPAERGATAPGRRAAPDWTVIAPAAVTLAVMLWGITAPAYWGDEADTVSAESRSLPQLVRLLGHVDAVHGLYYLLMWPVVRVAGPGEFATRLPSAVAMAAAAAGIAAIGRRLASRRIGLCAGLVFAAMPVIGEQGHNARPYATVTAAAVAASWLLVRAAGDPRWRWFAAYGGMLAVLGYLELDALLLVGAHAVALRQLAQADDPQARRGTSRRWAAAAFGAALAVAPLVVFGWAQRGQISWIHRPGWADARAMLASLGGGPPSLAAALWALAAIGCATSLAAARGRRGAGGWRLARLALPWLALPPAAMLAISQAMPVYNFRYVEFCVPALALLAGLGLAALGRVWRAGAAVLLVVLAVPAQLAMRVPGTGLRQAASILAAAGRPGDAIVYPGTDIPPWYLAYPAGFARLDNIGMARSPAVSGRLYGVSVPLDLLKQREQHARRIWVVEMESWQDPARYLSSGFRLRHAWQLDHGRLRIWLYQREPLATPAGSAARSGSAVGQDSGEPEAGQDAGVEASHGADPVCDALCGSISIPIITAAICGSSPPSPKRRVPWRACLIPDLRRSLLLRATPRRGPGRPAHRSKARP